MNFASIDILARESVRRFQFGDFDISWAGENSWNGDYYFGSEDGRFRRLDLEGPAEPASPSGEAVNGMAFLNRAMAISTRCDVSFILFDSDDSARRAVHHGGAHGVIATSSGEFVAPLGRNGLLTLKPVEGPGQLMATSKTEGDPTNIYKIAGCGGRGERELIIGASRRDGLLVVELDAHEDRIIPGRTRLHGSAGLDVVDVCALDSPRWPFAAAWLGADCTIRLTQDITSSRAPKLLRIGGLRGKAYTLLHSRGHLFLLTDSALHVLPDLAGRFLDGTIEGGTASALSLPVRATDIYLTRDDLMIHMDEWIDAIPLAAIDAAADQATPSDESDWKLSLTDDISSVSSDLEWSSEPDRIPA